MTARPADDVEDMDGVTAPLHQALTLDRVIHEPARLAILAVLSGAEEADFAFLLVATGLSKGNLSKQTAKLEESGYITIRKYYRGKIPATGYRITSAGRSALVEYGERITALGQSVRQPRSV